MDGYWLLFGTEGYHDGDRWVIGEKLVAIFTGREKLEAYVESAKLPTYNPENPGKFDQFHQGSILSDCSGYRACPLDTPELMIDPPALEFVSQYM